MGTLPPDDCWRDNNLQVRTKQAEMSSNSFHISQQESSELKCQYPHANNIFPLSVPVYNEDNENF